MKKTVWMATFLIVALFVGVGLEAQQADEDYEHQFEALRAEIEGLKYRIQRNENQESQCCYAELDECFVPQGFMCNSWVSVDYLFMLPCQAGMSYAVITEGGSLTANPKNVEHTFEWDSGVRVEAGYRLPCIDLDLVAQWTYFSSNNTSSQTGQIVFVTPLLGALPNAIVGGSDAGGGVPKSQWIMDLNMFDINLNYPILESSCFCLNSNFGVKGGWIEQKQILRYLNFIDSVGATPTDAIVTEFNNFYGGGLQAGIDTRLLIGCDVSLYTSINASLMMGKLNSPTTFYVEQPIGTVITNFNAHSKTCQTSPAIQLQIGLDWETCFLRRYILQARVGYEMQYYHHTFLNSNSLNGTIFVTNAGFGSLMLQGVTIGGGVQF